MHDLYWYCGRSIESQTIELDINEPGLLYGATVFTTFRTDFLARLDPLTRLNPRLLQEVGDLVDLVDLHCDRLRSSILDLDWCQPDWERVRSGVDCLTPHFPVLRITIFPDGRELITGRDLPPNLATWQQQGVTVIIADRKFTRFANGNATRTLPHHKTGNYLVPWLALKQARNSNIQEAILTNDRGDWLETTTGNLWGYRDGCWYTPPLSAGILPGIARSQIISALERQHRSVVEVEWNVEWVTGLEAIGYSNSVIHLIPIHTVLAPLGKLEYEVPHPAMDWLSTL
jgi:4-amino-4-deoxychorismate lyase